MSTPTPGRIVLYRLTDYDAETINRRRADAEVYLRNVVSRSEPGDFGRTGEQVHIGNAVRAGEQYPAVVVRVFDSTAAPANLQVLLDGNDTYWATSRVEGDRDGQWSWPSRQIPATTPDPTVGAVVHYVSYGTPPREDGSQVYTSQCRAAIITAVRDLEPVPEHGVPYVDLCVLNPEGLFLNRDCRYDEGAETRRGGSWHWPERVG